MRQVYAEDSGQIRCISSTGNWKNSKNGSGSTWDSLCIVCPLISLHVDVMWVCWLFIPKQREMIQGALLPSRKEHRERSQRNENEHTVHLWRLYDSPHSILTWTLSCFYFFSKWSLLNFLNPQPNIFYFSLRIFF